MQAITQVGWVRVDERLTAKTRVLHRHLINECLLAGPGCARRLPVRQSRGVALLLLPTEVSDEEGDGLGHRLISGSVQLDVGICGRESLW